MSGPSARLLAEEGRRKQLQAWEEFNAGDDVVFAVHNNPSGYKFSLAEQQKQKIKRQQKGTGGRKVKFHDADVMSDCIAEAQFDILREMVEGGVDPNLQDQEGMTALHRACVEGELRIVTFLLDNGADVNCVDQDGWTPLHSAAQSGEWRICNKLIQCGADVSAVNTDGDLPYDLASDSRVEGVLERAMAERDIFDKLEELRAAPESRMLAQVKKLVRKGKDVNQRNAEGVALLHIAACNGFTTVARLLLQQKDIDLEVTDPEGNTPLHLAAMFQQYELALMLALRGADTAATNNYGQRPIVLTDDDVMIRTLIALDKHAESFLDDTASKTALPTRSGSERRRSGSVNHKSRTAAHQLTRADASSERKMLDSF
eukprot:m.47198 g.47198  ORF g.47198 m.47198 type:complete len:373 (-) comp10961_c1_seq3:92-1210(-)